MSARRAVLVELSGPILAQVLLGHPYRRLDSDWPADARITSGRWDMDRQVVWLCVESAMFDELPELATIPCWEPTFTVHNLAPELIELMALHESATKS